MKYLRRADVIYPRFRYENGREFPFTPYDREAHLAGLNFVGTDVLLSTAAAELFEQHGGLDDPNEGLRELARLGMSFLGIDHVTYERNRHAS